MIATSFAWVVLISKQLAESGALGRTLVRDPVGSSLRLKTTSVELLRNRTFAQVESESRKVAQCREDWYGQASRTNNLELPHLWLR